MKRHRQNEHELFTYRMVLYKSYIHVYHQRGAIPFKEGFLNFVKKGYCVTIFTLLRNA